MGVGLSLKTLYGLQAVMLLASHYERGAMRIRDIAEQQRIPKKYLEAVLLELKKARLVQSIRGMRGGYQLRRAPADIRLSDIIPVRSAALLDIVRDARLRQVSERNAHYKAVYTVLL